MVCKVSFSPDFCVSQTEAMLTKVGPLSLIFAKFLPGVSLLSVAMAGITQMRLPLFLLLEAIGALLFVGAIAAFGWLFENEILSGQGPKRAQPPRARDGRVHIRSD